MTALAIAGRPTVDVGSYARVRPGANEPCVRAEPAGITVEPLTIAAVHSRVCTPSAYAAGGIAITEGRS
jgi:hypothetical protein